MPNTILQWCEECGEDMWDHGGDECFCCGAELCYACLDDHMEEYEGMPDEVA